MSRDVFGVGVVGAGVLDAVVYVGVVVVLTGPEQHAATIRECLLRRGPGDYESTALAALDALVAQAQQSDALRGMVEWDVSSALRAKAAEERASQLEHELEVAWAPDRHGHQISEPRWSLRDIERWMKAMLADEGQRETVLALARASQLEHERDKALRSLTTVVKEDGVVLTSLRREADQLRAALREIELHDGGGENGNLCRHRMAGHKHPSCRPVITRIARAALAGVQAKDEGEGCDYHHPIRVKGCRECDAGVQAKEHP